MPQSNKGKQNAGNAGMYLVCSGGRPIILEVEVAKAQLTRLAQRYSTWAGKVHSWRQLEQTGHAFNMSTGKWGSEYRIYFREEPGVGRQLERYGYMVESGSYWHKKTLRINNQDLFRELVQAHGLRLGENL